MAKLKKPEAAKHYGDVDVSTLDNWEKKGMPVMRAPGVQPLYDTDEIDAWFKSFRTQDGTKPISAE